MTERRVSVRLVAVGGSQVKAELVQIGQTGEAALGRLVPAAQRVTTRMERMGASSWNAGYRAQQMAFQLNDVFVSLASGQNPLTVFIQQGTQIAQIYGGQNGGVGAVMRDLAGMARAVVTRLGPLGAVIGAASMGILEMRDRIRETTGVTVTFGDTALAIWQVVRDGLWDRLKPAVDLIAPWFSAAWDLVVEGVIGAGNAIINGMRVSSEAIRTLVGVIPDIFAAGWAGAKEAVFGALYQMGTGLESLLNAAVEGFNTVFRTELPMVILDSVSSLEVSRFFAARDRAAAEGRAREEWEEFRNRAGEILDSDPMGELFGAVSDQAVENALNRTAEAADRAGGAGRQAGRDTAEGAETALSGWDRIRAALDQYALQAMDLAGGIGEALVGAFRDAEEAIVQFVKTGKLDFRDMVTTMIAELARLAARRFILGPLAGLLGSALGGLGGGVLASVLHQGGPVGGAGPMRAVPALAFAQAPRLHGGGWIGPDEVPAILQRGERVLSRREAKGWGAAPVTVTIMARDVESFRASRAQIGSDFARAVAAGRRGM
jgi:hypothetical protein